MEKTLKAFFFANIDIKGAILIGWGALVFITGNDPNVAGIVIALWFGDLIMGILTAWKRKTLSSDYIIDTAYKLVFYIIALASVNWFVQMNGFSQGFFGWLDDAVEVLIASAELISIFENADLLGFRYAKKIITMINNNVDKKLDKSCPPK